MECISCFIVYNNFLYFQVDSVISEAFLSEPISEEEGIQLQEQIKTELLLEGMGISFSNVRYLVGSAQIRS